MVSEDEWKDIFRIRDAINYTIFKKDLYGYQKRFSNLFLKKVILNEGGDIILEQCRQSGKTEAVCSSIVVLLLGYYEFCHILNINERPFLNIGIFAPQEDQSKTDFDRIKEYLKICKKAGFKFEFGSFNGQEIIITSNNVPIRRVYCFSASPTSNTESKTLHVIVFEECQDIQDFKITKTILPMGTQTNAINVYIGTAGYKRCIFHSKQEMTKPEDKIIITVDEAIRERQIMWEDTKDPIHLNYERYVERLDHESDEWKTQYQLVWVLERGQFITCENLMKLEKDIVHYHITYNVVPRTIRMSCGIDWGKVNDSTVVTFINKNNGDIINWLEIRGDDYHSQAVTISDLIAKHYYMALDGIYCDATANQDMQVDTLRHELHLRNVFCPVIGVKFTPQSKDKMFKNVFRLMHGVIQNGIQVEEPFIHFHKEYSRNKEKFIKQFLDLQKEERNNMWACSHPDGANYHDDFCSSLALACWSFGVDDNDIQFSIY